MALKGQMHCKFKKRAVNRKRLQNLTKNPQQKQNKTHKPQRKCFWRDNNAVATSKWLITSVTSASVLSCLPKKNLFCEYLGPLSLYLCIIVYNSGYIFSISMCFIQIHCLLQYFFFFTTSSCIKSLIIITQHYMTYCYIYN